MGHLDKVEFRASTGEDPNLFILESLKEILSVRNKIRDWDIVQIVFIHNNQQVELTLGDLAAYLWSKASDR